jgi:hypothetical protein
MRLAPHVSSQGRGGRSALRFSLPARTGSQAALRYRFSHPIATEAAAMPFRRKGTVALSERLDVRVSPDEKEQLRGMAASAGRPVAELVRNRALGRPIIPRSDATTIRELRRLGGLLKKVHVDSGGAYSKETAAALAALHAAIGALAAGQ